MTRRTIAVLCLAWLAMAAKHDSRSLRGLSSWVLTFIMRGRSPLPPSGAVTPYSGTATPARISSVSQFQQLNDTRRERMSL